MRVIDARSGQTLTIGQRVEYPDGEWLELVDVEPGVLSASAFIRTACRDPGGSGRVAVLSRQIPLTVRWLHPSFMFEHVAFIPS